MTDNDVRTKFADKAVQDFASSTGLENDDEETKLSDLLADLLHWSFANDVDFSSAMRRARGHVQDELLEDTLSSGDCPRVWEELI